MRVHRVGIREAKVQLSRLLKDVQRGMEWVITDRGRPVGKIVPFSEGALSLADRIKRLEGEGWIEPLDKRVRNLPPPLPLEGERAQKLLQEDRDS